MNCHSTFLHGSAIGARAESAGSGSGFFKHHGLWAAPASLNDQAVGLAGEVAQFRLPAG